MLFSKNIHLEVREPAGAVPSSHHVVLGNEYRWRACATRCLYPLSPLARPTAHLLKRGDEP